LPWLSAKALGMLPEKVVTHLQMTNASQLRPARTICGLVVTPVEDRAGQDQALLRSVHDRIAPVHRWSSLAWSQRQWQDWLSDPRLHHWWIKLNDGVIGWGCLREHSGPEVELDTFGIVPEDIGHGYGGYALTLLTQTAWTLGAHFSFLRPRPN